MAVQNRSKSIADRDKFLCCQSNKDKSILFIIILWFVHKPQGNLKGHLNFLAIRKYRLENRKRDGMKPYRPFSNDLLSFCFWHQQAVISVAAGINDVNFSGIRVAEHKESVPQQIHLQNSFLHCHGLHREGFTFATWAFSSS